MSATNRGQIRHKDDYYQTPLWCIENFVNWALNTANRGQMIFKPNNNWILDPCAGGTGTSNPMPYPLVFQKKLEKTFITTIDIRKDSPAMFHHDFLDPEFPSGDSIENIYDVVISNPPYKLATEFIKRGLECVIEGGYVIYLLRLNFFGSQSRLKFWRKYPAEWCIVSSKRPSFRPDGQTDACEYAHFVWRKSKTFKPAYTKTIVI